MRYASLFRPGALWIAVPLPTWLVTGGAGFIGSSFVLGAVLGGHASVVTLDALTYAGSLENLAQLADHPRHTFVQGSILDRRLLVELLRRHRPEAVVHLAAESHVDRSIDGPGDFVRTNVTGTFEVLEATRAWLAECGAPFRFRLLHVSTDEVYGSLGSTGTFDEQSRYAPSSPYAASKAAADHLVHAYATTYGLPTITTHCGNNHGPRQLPEKLVPLAILNARDGKPLPLYGDGQQVRDWIHVEDHCSGLRAALAHGRPGESYNLGGDGQRTNLDLVLAIADAVDDIAGLLPPAVDGRTSRRRELVTFVADRPGHDRRYAVDASKARRELGWEPKHSLDPSLRATVRWYLDNDAWVRAVGQRVDRARRIGLGQAEGLS